jgi:multicomponent Na+:H+ antiporter subunit B
MRRKWLAIFIGIIGAIVLLLTLNQPLSPNKGISEYYILNANDKISAPNVVTSIYLYFRYYDTLFETLVLLFCIIGIITLSVHEGEDHDD